MKKFAAGLLAALALALAAPGTSVSSTNSCTPNVNYPYINGGFGFARGWTSGCEYDTYAYTLKLIDSGGHVFVKLQGWASGNQYGETGVAECSGYTMRSQLYINVNGQGKTATSISKVC